MTSTTLTLHHEAGLHARPAALFVKLAATFQSAITVTLGAKTINAKSIVQVLTLGAKQGSTITVQADGPDEAAAIAALEQLVGRDFTEA
jgi:phosphocarrier protein HPr